MKDPTVSTAGRMDEQKGHKDRWAKRQMDLWAQGRMDKGVDRQSPQGRIQDFWLGGA